MPPTPNLRSTSSWFVVICLTVFACLPTTKFKGSGHCPAYLSTGDKVLLSSLPFDNPEFLLKEIRKEFSKRNVNVLYAPEEEFNLRAKGIVNPLDTTGYPMLLKNGITHIMVIREAGSQPGQFIASKTPFELSQEVNAYRSVGISDDATAAVEIAIHLVRLNDTQDYSFSVTTSVGGVRMQGKDRGLTELNAGGLTKARNVAIRKGARTLSEICK